jgi:hypothetical protein
VDTRSRVGGILTCYQRVPNHQGTSRDRPTASLAGSDDVASKGQVGVPDRTERERNAWNIKRLGWHWAARQRQIRHAQSRGEASGAEECDTESP